MIKSASRIFYYEEIKVNKYSAIAVAMSMCFSASAISQEHIKIKGLYLQMPEVEATKILANSLGVSPSDMVRVDIGEGKTCLFTPERFTGMYKRFKEVNPVEDCEQLHNNITVNWTINVLTDLLNDTIEWGRAGGVWPTYVGQGTALAYFVDGKMTTLSLSTSTVRHIFNYKDDVIFSTFAKAFIDAYHVPSLTPKSCTKNEVSPKCWEYKNDQNGELLSLLGPEDTSPGIAPTIMLFQNTSTRELKF